MRLLPLVPDKNVVDVVDVVEVRAVIEDAAIPVVAGATVDDAVVTVAVSANVNVCGGRSPLF